MSSQENLFWNVRMDRRLIETGGGQRHLVVDVEAPRRETATRQRQPLNLGLVIDVSGSMTGEPLAAAGSTDRGFVRRRGYRVCRCCCCRRRRSR